MGYFAWKDENHGGSELFLNEKKKAKIFGFFVSTIFSKISVISE